MWRWSSINIWVAVQNNLLDLIINTAETNKIPFQRAASV